MSSPLHTEACELGKEILDHAGSLPSASPPLPQASMLRWRGIGWFPVAMVPSDHIFKGLHDITRLATDLEARSVKLVSLG